MLTTYAFAIMLAILVTTSVAGMPIGISMIVSSVLYLVLAGRDVGIAAENVLNAIFGNYVALAVPLFIFAANIMNSGKISDRLLTFTLAIVGRYPGGLAQVNVYTSLIFSGMSGSAIADAAGVGKLITDMMMKDNRYPPGYAGAITAASAVVGPIFPPSIPMVWFALISSSSVGALFLGGVVPALMIVVVQSIGVWYISRKRGYPVEQVIPWRQFPRILLAALPALLMPGILLGGIYTGAFTPTEAAAVSALYALILAVFAYRTLDLKEFLAVLIDTARSSAVVTIILCGAFIFNYVIAVERVPQTIAAAFDALDMSPMMFLLVINLLYLVLGCLLDTSTILLVITPLFIPTAVALGINVVHLGVVLVLNMMIGLITPPYGVLLFIIKALNGIPLGDMIREIWLQIALLLIVLFLITYIPELVLFLPRMAGMLN